MARDTYRGRLAAQPAASADRPPGTMSQGDRTIRAIWAEDEVAVPIVRGFRTKFQHYPQDHQRRRIKLEHFDVCPLAGDASRAAYLRAAIGDLPADDFVLIFSDTIQQETNGPLLSSFFRSFTPADLAQADAPVFWLGAAQKIDLDLWTVGETSMKEFHWEILHHVPPGRFKRENSIELDDDIAEAVEKVLKHEKTSAQRTGEPKEKPAETGLIGRLFGFLHSDRKASHG